MALIRVAQRRPASASGEHTVEMRVINMNAFPLPSGGILSGFYVCSVCTGTCVCAYVCLCVRVFLYRWRKLMFPHSDLWPDPLSSFLRWLFYRYGNQGYNDTFVDCKFCKAIYKVSLGHLNLMKEIMVGTKIREIRTFWCPDHIDHKLRRTHYNYRSVQDFFRLNLTNKKETTNKHCILWK